MDYMKDGKVNMSLCFKKRNMSAMSVVKEYNLNVDISINIRYEFGILTRIESLIA